VPVGSVVTATSPLAGDVQRGTVKPYVNFSALDLVGVVVEPPRTDPRDALLDFAAAAEREEPVSRDVPLTDFRDVAAPPPRLWVVGGGHVAEHVVAIASRAGFSPRVIDPRRIFADPDRFGDAPVRVDWPDRAFAEVKLGASDYIVVLSHDPKIDQPALEAALAGEPAYVGAIGSSKAQADRRERLLAAGVSEERLARLHAPIGLPLGGREPGEIAVAIIGELIKVRHAAAAAAKARERTATAAAAGSSAATAAASLRADAAPCPTRSSAERSSTSAWRPAATWPPRSGRASTRSPWSTTRCRRSISSTSTRRSHSSAVACSCRS
jgi:xanthine dehydrogenase accessory factor